MPSPSVGTQVEAPEMFNQLGVITRQLHDTLTHLGVMPGLQQAASSLPDARGRLHYIAEKSGAAAEKVLDSVEKAKVEHAAIARAAKQLSALIAETPEAAVSQGAVLGFVAEVEAASQRSNRHLSDIMMAQDFHDLTSQVVAKVASLVAKLEGDLVTLLVQVAPADPMRPPESTILNGPVIDPRGRSDVVVDQADVDDLLTSLGF